MRRLFGLKDKKTTRGKDTILVNMIADLAWSRSNVFRIDEFRNNRTHFDQDGTA